MSDTAPAPRLSIVVAAWHGADALARCLAALHDAGVPADTEVIVARNWTDDADTRALLARYPRVTDLPRDAGTPVPRLRAAGLARARGEIVAFLEDHAAVTPRWREALLHAHALGHAGVGGPVANAPGATALDWAVYLYDYGRYAPPCSSAPTTQLSGINHSYKRAVLATLGSAVATSVYEDGVQGALHSRGHGLFLEAEAGVVQHARHTAVGATTQAFHLARGYAGRRSGGMSPPARAARTLGSALLPFVLLARVARGCVNKPGLRWPLARALPWLLTLLAAWSVGEAAGYAWGAGRSDEFWK